VVIQMSWWEIILFYADSPRKQRRYARHHGGEGHDGE
jgi:hypothetical protein